MFCMAMEMTLIIAVMSRPANKTKWCIMEAMPIRTDRNPALVPSLRSGSISRTSGAVDEEKKSGKSSSKIVKKETDGRKSCSCLVSRLAWETGRPGFGAERTGTRSRAIRGSGRERDRPDRGGCRAESLWSRRSYLRNGAR